LNESETDKPTYLLMCMSIFPMLSARLHATTMPPMEIKLATIVNGIRYWLSKAKWNKINYFCKYNKETSDIKREKPLRFGEENVSNNPWLSCYNSQLNKVIQFPACVVTSNQSRTPNISLTKLLPDIHKLYHSRRARHQLHLSIECLQMWWISSIKDVLNTSPYRNIRS